MKSLLKIFTILPSKQYKMCSAILFAMLVGAILEAVGIGAILPLISIMGNEKILYENYELAENLSLIGITTHTEFIVMLSCGLIVLYLAKNLYIAWESYFQIHFAIKNQIYYSKELLAEYIRKPYLFHINHNTATLIRNVHSGSMVTFSLILIPTLQLITEVMTAFIIWLMLVIVDPFTAIIVAGVLSIIIIGISRFFRRKITNQGIIQNNYTAQYIKWLNQSLGAIKETKILHKEEFFLREFNNAYCHYGKANGKFNFFNQVPRTIIEACVVSGLLVLIIVKLILGNTPMDIVPLLGVLALAAFRLMPSANRIINYANLIKFQMPFFNELYPELYSIRRRVEKKSDGYITPPGKKLPYKDILCVEHVGFHYPDMEDDVLSDVTFNVPKGKFVGIVGPSGAGKTTFVDILLGLLEPTSGKITVDGIDIFSDIRAWQENLAYVPQSIYLIDGTIKENIALGVKSEDISDEQIKTVLRMAELYDYIMSLPEGMNTQVGERGVKLSGGQCQRIGIARALYQQPEVLILDEATSALDNETEKSITETILKLKGTITIVSIAHRVSTLEACDYKVKFQSGRVEII
ncbi:ABC transporter ATP-binding protein [Anaerovibrio sp. RM50]|uniref:ABC transporter ATP-binding protein n=1 Tax=Anaerovibrio sp. RM50 TaxID=1200557 RepID=UPI0004822FD2|nr:ABC transporter ATP-binding protein [Anaerovibrio sp. RM50]